VGARAPTPITVQLASNRCQLQQLIERSAFVRSRRNGSSTVDRDSHEEPRIVSGAAELVEKGKRKSAEERVIEWLPTNAWNQDELFRNLYI